jgi:hypothetical protein
VRPASLPVSRTIRRQRLSPVRLSDHAASGNCYRVRLLVALLGRDYERIPVDITERRPELVPARLALAATAGFELHRYPSHAIYDG